MATTPRSRRSTRRRFLTLPEAAAELHETVDDLLRRPGLLALVYDLSGRKLTPKRLGEDDYEDLKIERADLDAWLETRRYAGQGVAA